MKIFCVRRYFNTIVHRVQSPRDAQYRGSSNECDLIELELEEKARTEYYEDM